MRLSRILALAGVLLAAAPPAPAATVRGLYEAAVPVRNQSPDARGPALQQALEAVLVRVTGRRVLPFEAADLMPRAGSLVQGYGYETAGPGRDLYLRAQFDGRAIDVPSCFIAGKSDWGIYQRPGSLERMQSTACSRMTGCHLIEGAGHWVQQEQPQRVSELLVSFLSDQKP